MQFLNVGDGNLVKKINPDNSKTLFVGGLYEVNKNAGGTATGTITYYPAGGAMRVNGTLYYMLKDHLGSASVVTDASGNIVGEQRYYPFGETRLATGTLYTDKLFTGQRNMAGLGIYHYQSRFYSPKLGRFISADTIVPNPANPQDLNRFSYVRNNPIRYIDPTGHAVANENDGGCFKSNCGLPTPPPPCTRNCSGIDKPNAPDRNGGGGGAGGNPCTSVICLPTPTPQPELPAIPIMPPDSAEEEECPPGRQCIGPTPENPSWHDLDPSKPDYYTLSVSIGFPGWPGGTATIAIDRYKNVYGGLGGNYGKSLDVFSASLTGGYIGSPFDTSIPDPVNIQSFLTGWAINGGAGIVGGGGVTWSPGANQTFVSNIAFEGGAYLPPSIGVSAVYSWLLGNPFIPGDQ